MSAATKKPSSGGNGMSATSSNRQRGPVPTEILIGAADELMSAIGELRKVQADFPLPPLARILDRILDARTTLMRDRDAAKKGKAGEP